MTVIQLRPASELAVQCPVCAADVQQPCTLDVRYLKRRSHLRRISALKKLLRDRERPF